MHFTRIITALLLAATTVTAQAVSVKRDSTSTDSVKVKTDSVKGKKDKKVTDYRKLVNKGGSSREGLFTVRHIEDKWYFEVPETKLGKLLLAVTRFTSVPAGFELNVGEEANDNVVYFEKRDEKTLLLRGYAQTQRADKGDAIAKAVQSATTDPIIAKFNIVQDGDSAKYHGMLIDVTNFYITDNGITGLSSNDRKQLKVGGQKQDLCYIDTIKTYPTNIEATTLRTYSMEQRSTVPASGTGNVTLTLNTSIVELPDEVMQPRLADERVGYFTTRYVRFRDYGTTDHEQIASRYKLVPKDKKAYLAGKLTEPEKQIVYYIDPATPKKWVPYLIAGIEDWNKAFEAAGFKNAITAKEWPNDPDMSIDDARYSVLLYLPSEKANAYGPRIVDPRSGEIMEAHICWYHNVTNLLRQWYMIQCGPNDKRAQKYDFDDKLMGELIRFVSSHEVGHTLGLRHNMVASNATPVEKLRDKKWVEEHGHTSSIMDYARFNYVAQPGDGITAKGLFPRVNDYDKWAIKWGYQWRPEFKDEYAEKKALRSEVTKALTGNKRLRYIGDEGRGSDPRSQTEDLSDNDMKADEYGMANLKRVMANIEIWTAQPDGQYDHLRDIYNGALAQYRRYIGHVQRWIGGKYINNWPAEKHIDYVSKDKQKEALKWMGRNVIDAPQWLYPESVVTKANFDPSNFIKTATNNFIAYSLNDETLDKIRKGGKYPVNEWLDDLMAEVWQPLDKSEWQNANRRTAERAYVSNIGKILNKPDGKQANNKADGSSDVTLYILQNMNNVEAYINAQLKSTGSSNINYLHYNDLLNSIKKIRKEYNGEH